MLRILKYFVKNLFFQAWKMNSMYLEWIPLTDIPILWRHVRLKRTAINF